MRKLKPQKGECDECSGEGEHECCECGTLVQCDECNGSGKSTIDKALNTYNRQFDKDMEFLKNLRIKESTIKQK